MVLFDLIGNNVEVLAILVVLHLLWEKGRKQGTLLILPFSFFGCQGRRNCKKRFGVHILYILRERGVCQDGMDEFAERRTALENYSALQATRINRRGGVKFLFFWEKFGQRCVYPPQ
jgi:hypothetical protein